MAAGGPKREISWPLGRLALLALHTHDDTSASHLHDWGGRALQSKAVIEGSLEMGGGFDVGVQCTVLVIYIAPTIAPITAHEA